MKKVFLSFSFRGEDRALNNLVERLVDSHNLKGVTGVRAAGQPLRERIFAQIEGCDALVALMTRRNKIDGEEAWTTSEWVKNELNHGRNNKLRTIALVENGVKVEGAFVDHERIHFSKDDPSDALLALSATLGLWKSEAGRKIKILIDSPNLLGNRRFINGQMRIEYRYLVDGEITAWQTTNLIREAGSAVVYLQGIQDDYLVQLGVRDGPNEWESDFVQQSIAIELKQIAGGAL